MHVINKVICRELNGIAILTDMTRMKEYSTYIFFVLDEIQIHTSNVS
jgi:hypothetical protein